MGKKEGMRGLFGEEDGMADCPSHLIIHGRLLYAYIFDNEFIESIK